MGVFLADRRLCQDNTMGIFTPPHAANIFKPPSCTGKFTTPPPVMNIVMKDGDRCTLDLTVLMKLRLVKCSELRPADFHELGHGKRLLANDFSMLTTVRPRSAVSPRGHSWTPLPQQSGVNTKKCVNKVAFPCTRIGHCRHLRAAVQELPADPRVFRVTSLQTRAADYFLPRYMAAARALGLRS